MFYKVKSVETKENYNLLVIFENDTRKMYDVSVLFDKYITFNQLRTVKGLFEQVKVDIGGFGISWNDEIDISCNELWNNGNLLIKFYSFHISKCQKNKRNAIRHSVYFLIIKHFLRYF